MKVLWGVRDITMHIARGITIDVAEWPIYLNNLK